MTYSDGEIREYIRKVVSESKSSARVETGYLKRSIRGALVGRNKSVEFRQIFYGAYRDNSKLIEIAQRIMPSDIQWKVIFINEEGKEQAVKGTTRTGRKLSRKSVTSENVSSANIKALINSIQDNAKKKNDTGEGDRVNDKEKP